MSSNTTNRRRPNILITGTPGTGKTTLASMIVERLNESIDDHNDDNRNGKNDHHHDVNDENDNDEHNVIAKHINVGEIVQTHQFYDGRDDELDTNILDEDKLIDYLDPVFDDALHDNISCVTDYHICTVFPQRYFDLVLVLRTSTELLYDRYVVRKYNEKKRTENIQSEIMQVIFEEAMDSYDHEIVHEVSSNTISDMESNVQRVLDWIHAWMKDHNTTVSDE